MAIHTFGEYLDFHPHPHALVADGLFGPGGQFRPLPDAPPEAATSGQAPTFGRF